MIRCRPVASLAAVLVLGTVSAPDASAQRSVVEGVARAEDGGAPIPFALVRLVPADSTASPSGTPPQGITSADGRYRFVGVAAGRYRVQLLRIGRWRSRPARGHRAAGACPRGPGRPDARLTSRGRYPSTATRCPLPCGQARTPSEWHSAWHSAG
jgi:hypothetical protein